ncbi:autotransporter domain-containing protein [Sphingomonas rhizophila]|uniref:Autotransporter domain-containing protein n=1 Tax=Sphingomonas rhizophila TaxID=2071607 RepID=A0A7G9SBS9_9SPHN|nr:autotransporter outer membrane beta-barrel domain-containing protein [Sphingomonas rhizophila]QNN65304.1 autotransporter domain-containing protein [Sphingomonas rhizophila]
MRHLFLASTCVVALATPLHAQTQITTATTAPVRSSTVKAGTPDDITITSTGSITTSGPVAVTIDSNHKVVNQGKIVIGGVNGGTGILANAGVTSGITNSGTITVDENYTPTDSDNDGDLDGPFALGNNRFGIRTLGAFTGNVVNSGTITIEGNDSAGILLGGPLTGNFTNDGTISVLGNNALGVGINNVTGNVRLAGTITAQGQNATAVRSAGDVAGAMVLQGNISATGYRYTTPPTDPSKLDADDLMQGGPAVSIEGDVTKGIIVAIPPKDNSTSNNDEDNDGIEDSKEGSAAIVSYGSAAALRIGNASEAVTIGATEGTATNFGLIVDGGVGGRGVYTGVDANALQIGGIGGSVSIANGIGVTGNIQAVSLDRAATAVRIGAGASTPELRNAGTISATSGAVAASTATAVLIDVGGSLPVLRNSKEISAKTGAEGTATAIVDKSGTLALIENSGLISASGATATSTRNVAIDLSANVGGATVRQTVVAASFAPPSIVGDVKFGSGSDLLDVADGTLTGNVTFGAGANKYQLSGDAIAKGNASFGSGADSVSLAGTSALSGAIDFGGGADSLSIGGTSAYSGQLTNASGASVAIAGGTWNAAKGNSIASLSVTGGGTIGVVLDQTAGSSSTINVSGTASFADNSKLQLRVANVAQAEGNYLVLTAGSLVGGDKLTASSTTLPFLYKGSLTQTGNQISVAISRKSAAELGLNASETAAYSAIYEALGTDDDIGDSFLAINEQGEFLSTIRQMLPDHAGGSFEAVTAGERAVARMLEDPAAPYKEVGNMTYWAGQVAWGSAKNLGSTAGFKVGGWGVTAGAEVKTAVGRLGASLEYLAGKNNDRETDNGLTSDQLGAVVHWRVRKGGFQAMARGSWNHLSFKGNRFFSSDSTGTAVERTIKSEWNGSLVSATAHASQQLWAGSFYIRPSVGADYYRLTEGAHQESGGGTALDLSVDRRKSDEFAVNGLLAAGIEFGPASEEDGYFALEVEGGRRQIVGGKLGVTVARFADGDDFTLTPEERDSGWVGRLRGIGGGSTWNVSGEVGAEQRDDRVALSARIGLTLGL